MWEGLSNMSELIDGVVFGWSFIHGSKWSSLAQRGPALEPDKFRNLRYHPDPTPHIGPSQYKDAGMGIPIIKIRRSHDCLIFIMEIHIHEKTVFIMKKGLDLLSFHCSHVLDLWWPPLHDLWSLPLHLHGLVFLHRHPLQGRPVLRHRWECALRHERSDLRQGRQDPVPQYHRGSHPGS